MKTGIIVQARMGSSRLPGKIMMDLAGKPMLVRVIERLKQVAGVDKIIIATTTNKEDDIVEKVAYEEDVIVFRGSEEDVLSRYYEAAVKEELDIIIRVTSDCPLIDPLIISEMLAFFIKNNYVIVSNATADPQYRTYPRGLDTEIFSFEAILDANIHAVKKSHREHVTLFIYENTNSKFYYKQKENHSNYRWTVDTQEDYEFVKNVYNRQEGLGVFFYQEDILELMRNEPELISINVMIKQKEIH